MTKGRKLQSEDQGIIETSLLYRPYSFSHQRINVSNVGLNIKLKCNKYRYIIYVFLAITISPFHPSGYGWNATTDITGLNMDSNGTVEGTLCKNLTAGEDFMKCVEH